MRILLENVLTGNILVVVVVVVVVSPLSSHGIFTIRGRTVDRKRDQKKMQKEEER